MSAQFLSIQKLKSSGIIQLAARHNLREIQAEYGINSDGRINHKRVALNIVLRGADTALGVAGEAQRLMTAAGLKPLRKDAVMGLEVLASLPPNSNIDEPDFFNDFVSWAEAYFKAPILSAIIHNDEEAPHCHILLLPLVDGRMVGSDLMGGRAQLKAMQADFYLKVGQRHGLASPTRQKRPSAAVCREAIEIAFNILEANSELQEHVIRALLKPHCNDPTQLFKDMGWKLPKSKPKKSFVEIMTKPCRPEKHIGLENKNPIGFGAEQESENEPNKEQTLSCVGFQITEPVIPSSLPTPNPLNQAQPTPLQNNEPIHQPVKLIEPATPEQEYIELETRFSDNDQSSSNWDCETGQHRGCESIKKMTNRQVVKNSVDVLLESISNRKIINRHLLI